RHTSTTRRATASDMDSSAAACSANDWKRDRDREARPEALRIINRHTLEIGGFQIAWLKASSDSRLTSEMEAGADEEGALQRDSACSQKFDIGRIGAIHGADAKGRVET